MSEICLLCGDIYNDDYCTRCGFERRLVLGDEKAGELKEKERAAVERRKILNSISVDVLAYTHTASGDGLAAESKEVFLAEGSALAVGKTAVCRESFAPGDAKASVTNWQLKITDDKGENTVTVPVKALTESQLITVSLEPVPETLKAVLVTKNNRRTERSAPFFVK